MKQNDALFELIKSLSKSEKRYFKLFASVQKGEKIYLQLFEAIQKQQIYDEDSLIKRFDTVTKKFSDMKYYLYQFVLKSMQVYRMDGTVYMQMKGMLNDVAFLFEKGLYEQCEKVLRKAKSMAKQHERYLILLELLNWELTLMQINSYMGKTEEDMERIFKEVFLGVKKYKQLYEYFRLSEQIYFKLNKSGQPRTAKDKKLLETYMNHPLLQSKEKPLSDMAQQHLNSCYLKYYFNRNDYENALVYAQKGVEILDAYCHPMKAKAEPFKVDSYVVSLHNLIVCQIRTKRFGDALQTIGKLKSVSVRQHHIKEQIFLTVSNLELTVYLQTGEFETALSRVLEIITDIRTHYALFHDKREVMILFFKFAHVYFAVGNLSAANKWLNEILNDSTIDVRNDIVCFAHLFHLIIHYEKGNEELLNYRVVAVQRFLCKREQLHPFEKVILDFFKKKLPQIFTSQDRINAFKTLKTQVERILKNPFEKEALKYFDFTYWIDSKIEGKSFAEVVRGKQVK